MKAVSGHAELAEGGRQIPRQNFRPFGQTLGAGWIGSTGRLRLLHKFRICSTSAC